MPDEKQFRTAQVESLLATAFAAADRAAADGKEELGQADRDHITAIGAMRPEDMDTDGDGVPDAEDVDADNDGDADRVPPKGPEAVFHAPVFRVE
jgi:hypothetical protein